MTFKPNDRVLVNKSQVATIVVYDESTGQLVLEQTVGGGTNTIYGPIAAYDLELLVADAVSVKPGDAPVEAPAESEEPPATDEFTTSGSL